MSSFEDNWLPNIVVNAVFYLIEHAKSAVALVLGGYAAARGLAQILVRSGQANDDLVPVTAALLGSTTINTSIGHLTASVSPPAPPRNNPPYSSWHTDSSETHRAVQDMLRFERNKMAAVLAAGGGSLGSPRVLLDQPQGVRT